MLLQPSPPCIYPSILTKPSPSNAPSTIPAAYASTLSCVISFGTEIPRENSGTLVVIISNALVHVSSKHKSSPPSCSLFLSLTRSRTPSIYLWNTYIHLNDHSPYCALNYRPVHRTRPSIVSNAPITAFSKGASRAVAALDSTPTALAVFAWPKPEVPPAGPSSLVIAQTHLFQTHDPAHI